MRKFIPPSYFNKIVAHRLYGMLSIKSAAEILGITDTTYLKYEHLYKPFITWIDFIPWEDLVQTIEHDKIKYEKKIRNSKNLF